MARVYTSRAQLLAENEELRYRLEEAEETLIAIRSGAVDALVVSSPEGDQVFTLAGAEHPYRVLMESMNEGAATLAPDATVIYCNGRLAAMLQTPMEKLIGSAFTTYIPPAYSSNFSSILATCRQQACTGELELVTRQGEPLPVLLSCSNLGQTDDAGMCLVVTDLSQQKRTEEVMAAEKLARSILEQAGEAIIVCDEHGRIIRASRHVQQLCHDRLLMRQFDELLPLVIAGTENRFSVSALLGGELFTNLEVVLRQRPDRIYHLLLNATPLKSGKDEILGCIVTLTDITERKRAEEALQEVNRELETFNYTVAHDLRKPLTVINGYAQILMEICGPTLDQKCQSYLRETYEGTLRMNRLISALLNFSRLAHAEPQRQQVDLSGVCMEVASELKQAEPERQVTFRITSGMGAEADQDLLQVVLVNLIGNAWKYTSSREEAIIEVGVTEMNGEQAYYVKDNGVGFDPADAEKLVCPFSTA